MPTLRPLFRGSRRVVLSAFLIQHLVTLGVAQDDPGSAQLLLDIDATRQAADVGGDFARVGPWSYFTVTADNADGIYRTLGSRASTELFFDPDPSAPQQIAYLTAVGGRLFFFAGSLTQRYQLWVSDGTRAGTRQVVLPGSPAISVRWARALGDKLVFCGDLQGGTDQEPWVTDGTAAGTQLLADTVPGATGSQSLAYFPIVVPGAAGGPDRLWFQAWQLGNPGTPATGIWSTDGTPAGTTQEATIASLILPRPPAVLAPGRVVFGGLEVAVGPFLYEIEQGRGLTQLPGDRFVISSEAPLPLAGRVHMGVDGADALLVTDGTVAGTTTIPLQGGSKIGVSVPLARDPGRLLFAYATSATDWRLGELRAGASTAVDLMALPGAPVVMLDTGGVGAALLGDHLFLAVEVPGTESLVQIDLAAAGGPQIDTLFTGGGIVSMLRSFGQLIFVAREQSDEEPWVTDGTAFGTTRLLDLQGPLLGSSSLPQMFVRFGDRVAFLARSQGRPLEPWITDGTGAGTYRLAGLGDVRNAGYFIRSMVAIGDELWTVRPDPRAQADLLVEAYDGIPEHRRTVGSLRGAAGQFGTSVAGWPQALGDRMLIYAVRDDGGRGVHAVQPDGSMERILPTDQAPSSIVPLGEQALLVLQPAPASERELWLTDGTVTGTRQVGTAGSAFATTQVARFRDHAWLSLPEGLFKVGDGGVELIDPTLQRLTLVPVGDRLFGIGQGRVVVTDGTPQGALELASGGQFGGIPGITAVALGERLLFLGMDGPWVSDGTVAGTHRLVQLLAADIELWVTGNTRALFPGLDPSTGRRALYVTDGTTSGTRVLEDLPIISDEPLLHEIGIAHAGKVLMLVDDPVVGVEPFVVDPRFALETRGAPCAGAGFATATLRVVGGDPRLGQQLRLDVRAASARLGWIVFGPVARRQVMLPGSACSTGVDLLGAAISQDLPISGPVLQAPLQVPNTTALLGVRVATQAWLATGRGPLGLDVTETLVMTIGR